MRKILNFFRILYARMTIEDEVQLEKTEHNIRKEPWVTVANVAFQDPSNPTTGYFELDWNKEWIEHLRECGYGGRTDEETMDLWFNTVCRNCLGEDI